IAEINSSLGITPASLSLLALTIIMNLIGVSLLSLVRQTGNFHHRPDLDGSETGCGNSFRNTDRLIEILRIDQVIPAELFTSFGEWPIRYEPFALAHTDTCGRRNRVQRRRTQIFTGRIKILSQ